MPYLWYDIIKQLKNPYVLSNNLENDDSTEGMIEEKVQEMTKKLLKMKVWKHLINSVIRHHEYHIILGYFKYDI